LVSMMVAKNLNRQNADKLGLYLSRLMPDIAATAAHDAIARDGSLRDVPEVKALIMEGSRK
jgi:hypothetical protein